VILPDDNDAKNRSTSALQRALASAPVTLFTLDPEGRILLIEGSDRARLGLMSPENIGRNALTVYRDHPALVDALRHALGGVATRTMAHMASTTYELLLTPQVVPGGTVTGVVGVATDATAWVRLARHLRHQATHDALTGLPNKALFYDRLTQALHGAARAGDWCAVALLDLDGFKGVNDSYGHACGDALLARVAARLGGVVRASDTVARLGGDEFGCILPATDGDGADRLLAQIRATMTAPFGLDDGIVRVGLSAGVAIFPLHGTDKASLLRHADQALYQAKGRPITSLACAHPSDTHKVVPQGTPA